jgi:ketosteroid isomerase-like protein
MRTSISLRYPLLGFSPIGQDAEATPVTQNVETLRQIYEAFNDRDIEALMEGFHPDIEIEETQDLAYAAALLRVLGPRFVILSGGYKGHEEVKKLWETVWEISEWFLVYPQDYLESGEHVVVPITLNARAKGTGLEGEAPTAHLWQMRDGKGYRLQVFADKQQALAASRLPNGADIGEAERGTGLAGL